MIGYDELQKKVIVEHVRAHFPKAAISAFGSRVTGKHRVDSDLDLLITSHEPKSFSKQGQLRDAMENDSRLPFRVDAVFADQISPDFLATIQAHLVSWD